MKRKGLTITYVVKAFPMNYDEGYGNVSVAKKVHRGDGTTLPFTSRQALRYSITKWLFEHGLWEESPLKREGGGDKAVIQYDKEALQEKFYEEADLFGYMITEGERKALTRSAVARLTHLISLDPYYGDQEFLSNMGFASRYQNQLKSKEGKDAEVNPNIANVETAYNYYKYTLNIDLDLVGIDDNFRHNLDVDERIRRVQTLLEATKYLYRDIRGRREDLKPILVIGGVFPIKSPFFHNAVRLNWIAGRPHISTAAIAQVLNMKLPDFVGGGAVSDYSYGGLLRDEFPNQDEFMSLKDGFDTSPFDVIDTLKEEVEKAYREES